MRHPRVREVNRAVIGATGEPIDYRPARVRQAEEGRDLVVRLPRRIVAGLADEPAVEPAVRPLPRHLVEVRMPARDHQHDRRQGHRAAFHDERFDMSGQMLHADEGHAEGRGGRFGEGDAHEQRSDQPRSLRDRDCVKAIPAGVRLLQRPIDDAADVAHMLARGKFRDNAAPGAVDLRLGRDDVRTHVPRPGGIAGVGHHRGSRLVARGLDGKQQHRRQPSGIRQPRPPRRPPPPPRTRRGDPRRTAAGRFPVR